MHRFFYFFVLVGFLPESKLVTIIYAEFTRVDTLKIFWRMSIVYVMPVLIPSS